VPNVPPAYLAAVRALTPILDDLPGKIVAIDGRDGVGKTTLGRYLAWQFNVSLIETDLFLFHGTGKLQRRTEEISRIIEFRLKKPRPVIVEGVKILQLFDSIRRRPDFLIYAQVAEHSTGETMEHLLSEYEAKFNPKQRADLVLDLEP
jgi:cytidylate kinase